MNDPLYRAAVGIGGAYLCPTNDDDLMLEAAQDWLDEANHTENTAQDLWQLTRTQNEDAEELEPFARQLAEGLACRIVDEAEIYID